MKYTLDQICSIQNGGTPKRSNAKFYNPKFIPWAKVGDISDGGIINKTEEWISEEGLNSIGNRIFEEGTLLFAMYGSVGKTALAGRQISCNQAILGINALDKDILDIRYLKYWFEFHRAKLIFKSKGGVLKNLNITYIKQLDIDIPSIDEQLKIIKKFQLIETIISKRKQSIKSLDKYIFIVFIESFGDPILNKKKWPVKKIEEIGRVFTGNTPSRKIKNYYTDKDKGILEWVKNDNIVNSKIFNSEATEWFTEIGKTKARVVPKNSILIISITGSYSRLGDCCLTKTEVGFNQQINALVLKKYPYFFYVQIKLLKPLLQNKTTSGLKRLITKSMLSKVKVIFPNNPEILDKFENKFKKFIDQKNKLERSLQLLEEYYEVNIYQTFSGGEEKVLDEIDLLIEDDIKLEIFFNTINSSAFESEELYNSSLEDLYKISDRTKERNEIDSRYLKGIIQRIHNKEIVLEANKENKFRLSNEVT